LDQNKCCCVHDESGDFFWRTGFHYPGENAAEPRSLADSERFIGCVNSNPASALELVEGCNLEGLTRVLDPPYLQHEEYFIFGGIHFHLSLICFVQEQEQHQDDPSARTVVLEFGEVRLGVLGVDSDGDRAEWFTNANEHHHGVTLPHLFEHLKGWEDLDD
jgi:hypothetical protein